VDVLQDFVLMAVDLPEPVVPCVAMCSSRTLSGEERLATRIVPKECGRSVLFVAAPTTAGECRKSICISGAQLRSIVLMSAARNLGRHCSGHHAGRVARSSLQFDFDLHGGDRARLLLGGRQCVRSAV